MVFIEKRISTVEEAVLRIERRVGALEKRMNALEAKVDANQDLLELGGRHLGAEPLGRLKPLLLRGAPNS